jgi:NAD(P)-dependent dehydrogenase (short-subunit alcohol dehydrogenase family)
VVVIASEWGVTGWPEATAYAASKAGLISLVKTLGRELAPEGIIVNGIAPGVTDTPQLQVDADAAGVSLAEIHRRYAAGIPVGRIGRPEEISAAVSLLCDFRLSSMIGQIVQVNGGTTRSRV